MVFNFFKLVFLTCISTSFVSCVGVKNIDSGSDENLIGNKLENVSSLKTTSGNDSTAVVIFDPILQKIHHFNLDQMSVVRTLEVLNSDQEHFVLHDSSVNTIIDLSLKHITIFDKYSNPQNNPIRFFGKPVSAAYRPELGLLVMYDDLQTAGIVQLDQNGIVQKASVFGSIVSQDQTIVAGDLLENGNLVLSLSNNTLAQIDIAQSIQQGQWISQIQNSGLTQINWIAPVPSKPNLVFIKSKDQVSLYDLNLQAVVSSVAIANTIEKYSKLFNPHILERVDDRTLKLIYTDGIALKTKILNRQFKTILTSDLDINKNMWSFVETDFRRIDPYANNVNIYKNRRQIVRYRLSDLATLQSKDIPDRAEVKLANDFFFCLFPSDLGYATKNSVQDESISVIKNFNLKKF